MTSTRNLPFSIDELKNIVKKTMLQGNFSMSFGEMVFSPETTEYELTRVGKDGYGYTSGSTFRSV